MDEMLDVNDVAKFLKLSKITVYKLAKKGELPFIRIGSSYRMKESVLIEYIKEKSRS